MMLHKMPKRSAVTIDTKTIGERNRDLPVSGVRKLCRLDKRKLRVWRIKQITLHVCDFGGLYDFRINIGGTEFCCRTEKRAHRALRVR